MKYETELQRYADSVPPKSRRKQTARVRAFLAWLGNKEPSKRNLFKYRDELQKRYADLPIRQDFMCIRKFYYVNGWPWPIQHGDIIVVRQNEINQPILGVEWISDMIDVVLGLLPSKSKLEPTAQHKAFICASTMWGLRRIEVLELRSSWLDTKSKTIFIQTAKGGRQRYHSVPDYVIPHLEEWGFRTRLSVSRVDNIFKELKEMVGFTGPISRGVGWHAIRRSAIKQAWRAKFDEDQVHHFFRYKAEGKSMALRYAGGREIGKDTEFIEVPIRDRDLDIEMYKRHLFPRMWEEKSRRLVPGS